MAINEITIDIDYDLPDDIYHQTNVLQKKAYVKYKGPNKRYVWISSITNKIIGVEEAPQGERMFNGEMPMPEGDHYLVEVDAEANMTNAIVCAMFGGVDPLSIPDIEEDVPGHTVKYVRDKYPIPDHTYERDEIQYSPTGENFITPFPWRKPITTWEEQLKFRDNFLMNSDRISSEDLPSSASTAISEYRTYLRNITETLGVAWTASIPTGGTGYAQGDVLLVQDPKYKNSSNLVDEVKLTVTTVSGAGAITGFSVENKRALYHPEAATYTECFYVTNGAGTGAKVTLAKVKQTDPWKIEWKEQPLLTIAGEQNLAKKSDSVATNTEDAVTRESAQKTYKSAHELAVQ